MYSFAFRSHDPTALHRLCTRYLNEPLGVLDRFSPLLDVVFFSFTWIRWVTSQHSPYSEWGGSTELELAMWVPVRDAESPLTVRWFAPYMFVDSSMATWQGREIYGFPKEIARFEPDFSGDLQAPPVSFDVSGLAIPKFGPTAKPSWLSLVRVHRPPDGAPSEARNWKSLDEVAEEVTSAIITVENEIPKLLPPQGKLLTLKQCPDERDGRLAAYQRVLETPCTVHLSGFRPGGALLGYRLAITPADSHPITCQTGLPGTNDPALFGYWLRCSFTMENAVPL
jgi:hypothetical protein